MSSSFTFLPTSSLRYPRRVLVVLLLLLLFPLATTPSLARSYEPDPEAIAALGEPFRQWLDEVKLLISDEEIQAFLELDEDYQRKAFIERFWRQRDPYPDTARNEFRDRWYERLREIRVLFSDEVTDDRAKVYLLNGPPSVRKVSRCIAAWPLEAWVYAQSASERTRNEFALVFVQYWGNGPYRIWFPADGASRILKNATFQTSPQELLNTVFHDCADGEALASIFGWLFQQDSIFYQTFMEKIYKGPEPPSGEWVATFDAYSTEAPEDAPVLPARLEIAYPGRHQSRTQVQGSILVSREAAGVAELGGHRSFDFLVTGEVLRDEELFESFRYKFDFPATEVAAEEIPLVFQRRLRPGDYELRVKVEDLNGDAFFTERRGIEVPGVGEIPPPSPDDPESARLMEEAAESVLSDRPTLRLIRPHQEILTGLIRFDTLVTGTGIEEAIFYLDDRPVLRKRSAPFSVELDLGDLPRTRVLRVAALDDEGRVLDDDEVVLNTGSHRFAVRIKTPRPDARYEREVVVDADVAVPEDRSLERVEIFLDDDLVATLYQPPWAQTIHLSEPFMAGYVRVVAYLPDGNSTEDTAFLNTGFAEDVDVDYVELFTAVVDRGGRPVEGLAREDFAVEEDGNPQSLIRFEVLRDLPIHVIALLDVSASMEERLDPARRAALSFFEETVRPQDRAGVITFNDRPNLAVKLTSELDRIGGGLSGLKAERGTALYDAVVFSLYYFNGIKGQRALLLLSDGKDESSRFTWENCLEYARRSGVAIYSIGLDLPRREGDARKKLARLAEETGGASFFIDDVDELAAVYAQIERELRSRYLLTYQSTNVSGDETFRRVDVEVRGSGLEAKTIRGYYP